MSVASFVAAQRTEHGVPHARDVPGVGDLASRGSTSGATGRRRPASSAAPRSTRR